MTAQRAKPRFQQAWDFDHGELIRLLRSQLTPRDMQMFPGTWGLETTTTGLRLVHLSAETQRGGGAFR